MSEVKKLNKQQLEAVKHGSGPLLVIAGAGTGKTTVITERVKWLIAEKLAQPSEILALTFTEKAAREMEERIDVALPYGYTQMWVMTFHAFGDRVLRDEGLAIGLDTGYQPMTEADSVNLIRRHIFDFDLDQYRPLGNPAKFISALLQHFSRLQDEDVTAEEYLKHTQNELSQAYKTYTELKIKNGALDFGDLIFYTLKLFRTRSQILSQYQSKFKYILVDEFQDTNYAQNELVKLLAGKPANLTVVADDDQAVYRWRGAAISNVVQFKKTYPKAKLVTLTQNYRSTQEILDRAYTLIQHNNPDRLEAKEGIDKKLIAVRQVAGEPVEFIHADRVENEADAVAKKIRELLDAGHFTLTPKDFAILVRANAHAEAFTRALSRNGLPYQFLGPGRLFKQSEIKDLIAYLQVVADFTNDAALYRVLSQEYFNLAARDLIVLTNFAKKNNLSVFETCETAANKLYLSSDTKDTLKQVVDLVHQHQGLARRQTAGQILYGFLIQTGMLKAILDYRHPIDERRAANMMKFFNKLKSFESEHEDASVRAVVDWLDLAAQLGESPMATDTDWTQNDAVNILTVHSAKGLEFPVVFLVNLVAQRFPTSERQETVPIPGELIKEILPEGDFHLQEERRLAYVGMTRARDRLFLTAADYYGEAKRIKKLSPFIVEALGESAVQLSSNLTVQPSLLDWQLASQPPQPAKGDQSITVNYLSYSQIQTFLDCPLHYKAKYILKIPTPPSAASTFGNTIHAVLRDFYRDPSVDILKLLEKHWTNEGYDNQKHAQLYFARGKKYLHQFVKHQYDPRVKPAKLEEPFTVPLTDNLKIGGKIDRVDVLADSLVQIIDYKTSIKSLTEKEASEDLQLSFYALAATRIPEPPFGQAPERVKLSLYYFEEDKWVTTTRTPEQLQAAIEQIQNYADQIAHSDFKCCGSALCKICDFKILCDGAAD